MRRTESKAKSIRRPLSELSKNNNNGRRNFFKSEIPKKKMAGDKGYNNNNNNQNGAELDRLLLLQSDLSSLIRQIDELVVQAFKIKATEHGTKEIESFTNVVSKMLSSLKPWFSRFEKAISSPNSGQFLENVIVPFLNVNAKEECFDVGSPEETTLDSLISPSPLVSWRAAADCNVGKGRQLFLLTPLPLSKALSSKRGDLSKSTAFERVSSKSTVDLPSFLNIPTDENDDLLEGVAIKPITPLIKPSSVSLVAESETDISSSPVFSKRDSNSMLVMSTPCLKMSPPKSCVLLEPIHESSRRGDYGVVLRKSTPFPVGISSSCLSESSGSEASEDLNLKYPELRGIQRANYVSGIGKKELESSPTWLFSPPKSCILLEPPVVKSLENVATDTDDHHLPITCALNQQTKLAFPSGNGNDVTDACQRNKRINQESTPMWKEPESIMQTGKTHGETTLKKELWTKFEAVSTCGLRYNNASAIQTIARKGFLDMLDEVSCDYGNSVSSDGLR